MENVNVVRDQKELGHIRKPGNDGDVIMIYRAECILEGVKFETIKSMKEAIARDVKFHFKFKYHGL